MIKDVKNKKIISTSYTPICLKNAVECKLPLLEEEVQSVIKLDAKAILYHASCGENEVRYDGKVIFTALLGGLNLKKCEMGVEFSYKNELKGVIDSSEILGKMVCDNVKIQVVNGISVASCALTFISEVLKNEESDYVCDVSDLQVKKLDAESACVLETVIKDFDLEDEFELNYSVNEILWHEQSVRITEIISTIGAISISGDVEVSYLTLDGENKPIFDKKTIPFIYEADAKTAMPDLISEGFICVKDAQMKVFVDEIKNKSTVSVIMKLTLTSKVIENQPISYIQDAFSLDYCLTLDKKSVRTHKCLGEVSVEKTVNHKATSEFEKNTLLVCPLFAKIEEIELTAKDSDYRASGIVQVGMLLQVEDSYSVQTSLIPFEFDFEKRGDIATITDKVVCGLTVAQAGSQLTVDFTVRLRVRETVISDIKIVSLIEEGEERIKSNSAISVFIPKNGDTLWDVCKNIGILEDDVLKVNPDLTFPTSGEERIIIYREIK